MLHFRIVESPQYFYFSAYASNLKSIILSHFKIFLRQAVKNINCQGHILFITSAYSLSHPPQVHTQSGTHCELDCPVVVLSFVCPPMPLPLRL